MSILTKVNALPLAYGLTASVSLLALYVWASSQAWQFSGLSLYQLFPLLGLLAFSIMWSHYIIGTLKLYGLSDDRLDGYFSTTGWVVLVAILLHPGLLIYQRFRDGFGLPPHSYESYVAPSMAWLTLLGSVSLLVFLAFELHRWYGQRRWWQYVLMANDAAMLAIFYHGLALGSQTHVAWFRLVWWFYGITLAAVLVRKYAEKLVPHSQKT